MGQRLRTRKEKETKMKLKRTIGILPGLKVDMELSVERDSLTMLKMDPQNMIKELIEWDKKNLQVIEDAIEKNKIEE